MSLLCRSQFLRVGKFLLMSLALVFVSYWHVPKSSAQQIRVVPSIAVLQQYDSNVFFTPKSQLAAGTKADDLITTLTPQLNFMQSSNVAKTSLSLGAIVQKFANCDYSLVNQVYMLCILRLCEENFIEIPYP